MMVFNNIDDIHNCLQYVENFDIFSNGEIEKIDKDNNKFNGIVLNLKRVFKEGFLLPAFGVSMHQETLNELESGKWLQINFNEEQIQNGLNFNSLLFKLETTQGFNLIRKFQDRYDGRCLYLNLSQKTDLNSLIE